MSFFTLSYSRLGCLFSCTSRGRAASVNETVRVYLTPGKFAVDHLDAKILAMTPTEVWDPDEKRYRGGYIYDLQMDNTPLAGPALIEACDVHDFGCPLDVNVDVTTLDVLTGVRLEGSGDCVRVLQTVQKLTFFGEPNGAPVTTEVGQHCIIHPERPYPYPYASPPYSNPATW